MQQVYVLVNAWLRLSPIRKIKHEECGQDANEAWSTAECFIGIEGVRQVLYFMYSKS